jgi:Cu/Ag efflux protein CusF
MNALVTALYAAVTIGLAAALPAFAAESPTHATHGIVRSVDAGAGTAKITHDPIKSLKWPKMTMDFRAADPALLEGLKPGMEVDFEIMKAAGGYRIMTIGPAEK